MTAKTRSLILGAFCALVQRSFCQVEALRPLETRRVTIPPNLPETRIPNWSGGALVTMNDNPTAEPILYAHDPNRNQVYQFPFLIPEGQLVFTRSFKRSPQGIFAVVGGAVSREGKGAAFLGVLRPGGELRLVRLGSFYPHQVVIAGDGTLWVAGVEGTRSGEAPNYYVLRRYSDSGVELGRYVLRSSLHTDGAVYFPAANSHLAASRNRVGWYSNYARVYMEFTPDGETVTRVPGLSLVRPARVNGLGLCESGAVFVSVYPVSTTQKHSQIYELDRSRGIWKLVYEADAYTPVYGCDEEQLVVRVPEPGLPAALAWWRFDTR